MRRNTLLILCVAAGVTGCSGSPEMRPDPVDVTVAVQLPGGSPRDLTVSFNPTEDGQPTGGRVRPDGTLTLKAIPGKYVVFFPEGANASVPAYKHVPASYRTPSREHTVSLSAGGATVGVK